MRRAFDGAVAADTIVGVVDLFLREAERAQEIEARRLPDLLLDAEAVHHVRAQRPRAERKAQLEDAGKRGIQPMGRIVSWGIAGVDPKIMGSGPVPATKIALQKAGMTLEHIDLIEVNEAFAAQYLAVEKELGLDREKVNVNGGAIALGHPLGATGTRLVITVLYELRRRKKKYGLTTACIGGWQGIAMVVESLN